VNAVFGWIVSYLARWLPAPVESGLRAVGHPDERSPVLVTANFRLTVRRLTRAVRGADLWILVVNTDGINVWCAATGGHFTESRVIDAITICNLAEKVRHRQLTLPALSAPGIDTTAIARATGFHARFGPVRASDVSQYLATGEKPERMRRFDFGPRHRIDMFLSMNTLVYLPIAAAIALIHAPAVPGFTALFWSAVAFLYLFMDILPGRSGWTQALVAAAVWDGAWVGIDWIARGAPLRHWPWLIALPVIMLLAGIDLAGTASGRRSDFELLLHRVRHGKSGPFMTARSLGTVRLDRETCIGCGTCNELCPTGVFGEPDAHGKTTLARPAACFSCGACVKQCPTSSLSLEMG